MRYFMYMFLITSSAQAAVNDVLPGDYFPLTTGKSSLAVYAFDRQSTGPYSKGAKLLNGNLNTQIAVLRGAHFIMLGDTPIALTAVLPWSQNSVGPAPLAGLLGKEATGTGDLRIGATSWLVANRQSGEYVGVTGMLFMPTGAYNNRQALNTGENRYKFTLNAGWIRPLSNSLILEALPELVWYGDNTDYVGGKTLAQKTSRSLTSYLRYRLNPNWQFHLGAQINRGGETQLNGIGQNNAPDNTRAMLGTTYLTDDKTHQWIFRVAKDTVIRNGFMTKSEVMLRYQNMF